MSAARPCTADIILIHSVLRFIPRAEQAPFLRQLGRWLAPEGRLVISNRILFDDDGAEAKGEIRKRTAANKAVQEALAQGRLRLPESPEATLSRLERAIGDSEGRPGEFRSLDEFKSLIEESGLEEISVEDLFWDLTIGPSDLMRKRRVHAVLAQPTADSRNYDYFTIG